MLSICIGGLSGSGLFSFHYLLMFSSFSFTMAIFWMDRNFNIIDDFELYHLQNRNKVTVYMA